VIRKIINPSSMPPEPIGSSLSEHSLPKGWKWIKLGEIIQEALPGFACGERDPKGVIQLRMNNVNTGGNLVWDEFIRVPAEENTIARFQLMNGDVVFNNTNSVELVGKSALFQEYTEPVVYSNHFTRLRVDKDRVEPGFLASWLVHQWKSRVFENLCNRWIGQSAVKNDKLFDLDFPFPPLREQVRIVAKLHDFLQNVALASHASEKQTEFINALPQVFLGKAFKGEL